MIPLFQEFRECYDERYLPYSPIDETDLDLILDTVTCPEKADAAAAMDAAKWEAAEKLWAQAYCRNLEDETLIRLRAFCALKMKKHSLVEACLCHLVRLNPHHSMLVEMGDYFRSRNNPNQARTCWERAIEAGNRDPKTLGSLIHIHAQRRSNKTERYEELLASAAPGHYALIWLQLHRAESAGDFHRVLQCLRELEDNLVYLPSLALSISHHEFIVGEHERALERLEFEADRRTIMDEKYHRCFDHELAKQRYMLEKHDFAILQHDLHNEESRLAQSPFQCRGEEWNGLADLTDKHLRVYGDQGRGDNIQFIRFVPLMRKLSCAGIILRTFEELIPLFDEFLNRDPNEQPISIYPHAYPTEAYPGDAYVSLLNLPRRLRLSREQLPGRDGYLRADPQLVEKRRRELGSSKLRIGVKWQGNPRQSNDRRRSCSLYDLLPLRDLPGVQLYSFHYDPDDRWLERTCAQEGIVDLSPSMLDFSETAALMSAMNLIVTVDTSIAHLGGAMGLPTWVLAATNADWRYPLQDGPSFWYRSQQIIRQRPGESWSSVVDRLVDRLKIVHFGGRQLA